MQKRITSFRPSCVATAGNPFGQTRFFMGGKRVPGGEPRQWLYATRPLFARLDGSLAKALEEVEEVRLLVDLGSFRPGDVRLEIKPDRYSITAIHGKMQFFKEIPLPKSVDAPRKEEHFKSGILELVLPRKSDQ